MKHVSSVVLFWALCAWVTALATHLSILISQPEQVGSEVYGLFLLTAEAAGWVAGAPLAVLFYLGLRRGLWRGRIAIWIAAYGAVLTLLAIISGGPREAVISLSLLARLPAALVAIGDALMRPRFWIDAAILQIPAWILLAAFKWGWPARLRAAWKSVNDEL